jgi:hypothetical protein
MGMIPSIDSTIGNIELNKFVDFEGYKSQSTYNIQQESSIKYYVIGAIVLIYFLMFKKK